MASIRLRKADLAKMMGNIIDFCGQIIPHYPTGQKAINPLKACSFQKSGPVCNIRSFNCQANLLSKLLASCSFLALALRLTHFIWG
jgi:hypothetical protein